MINGIGIPISHISIAPILLSFLVLFTKLTNGAFMI